MDVLQSGAIRRVKKPVRYGRSGPLLWLQVIQALVFFLCGACQRHARAVLPFLIWAATSCASFLDMGSYYGRQARRAPREAEEANSLPGETKCLDEGLVTWPHEHDVVIVAPDPEPGWAGAQKCGRRGERPSSTLSSQVERSERFSSSHDTRLIQLPTERIPCVIHLGGPVTCDDRA